MRELPKKLRYLSKEASEGSGYLTQTRFCLRVGLVNNDINQ